MAVALSVSCNKLEESDRAHPESGTWQWLCQHRVMSLMNHITHKLRVGHGSDSVSIVYDLEESDHAQTESGIWHWLCQHHVMSSKN